MSTTSAVFFCSVCTREKGERTYHSGECADQPGMGYLRRPAKTLYPAIGTRWLVKPAQGAPQGGGMREIFTVKDFDAISGYVIGVSSVNGKQFSIEVAAWHEPTGGKCIEGPQDWRWCMVPVEP